MRHFVDDDYDSMAEYECHCGGLHYEPDEEEHSILYHKEDYENDYDHSMISHFRD